MNAQTRPVPDGGADVLALLHLVDRAADGRLLPAEAQLLRDGIQQLAKAVAR